MSQSKYLFENGQYLIEDKELHLSHKEQWNPLRIPEDKTRKKHPETDHFFEIFTQGPIPYAYGWLKNKQLDGEYLQVFADGKIKGRQYYKEGKLHGPSLFFTASGHILSEAWYIDGQQEGRCNWYTPEQKIYSRQHYSKGGWHGLQHFYFADGSIKSELNYDHGKLHGTSKLYYPDGKLERLYEYNHGKLVSMELYPRLFGISGKERSK